jgi:hypothetical protein
MWDPANRNSGPFPLPSYSRSCPPLFLFASNHNLDTKLCLPLIQSDHSQRQLIQRKQSLPSLKTTQTKMCYVHTFVSSFLYLRALLLLQGQRPPLRAVVAGGGPAGRVTAFFLAKRGFRVDDFERRSIIPRPLETAGTYWFLTRGTCLTKPLLKWTPAILELVSLGTCSTKPLAK